MSWFSLPPVGHRIALSGEKGELPNFAGYQSIWTNSGTASLALALIIARQRMPEIDSPEVILPGYGCPDLVAAAHYAGVRPVLVDIGADDPGYDLACLRTALSPNTVALIAVNFLGVRERLTELRELLSESRHVLLIEDNAQWFPEHLPNPELVGDAVCLSFGRGKPVGLLGGGCLLLRHNLAAQMDEGPIRLVPDEASDGLIWKIKMYNVLLHPACYGMVQRLPFLRLGKTEFKPLSKVVAMDSRRLKLLPQNIHSYLLRTSQVTEGIRMILSKHMDLPGRLSARAGRLLRYPVLCDSVQQRDRLLEGLCREGLGATAMYRSALPEVPGVYGCVANGVLDGSRNFASRLLTLPAHAGVNDAYINRIEEVFKSWS